MNLFMAIKVKVSYRKGGASIRGSVPPCDTLSVNIWEYEVTEATLAAPCSIADALRFHLQYLRVRLSPFHPHNTFCQSPSRPYQCPRLDYQLWQLPKAPDPQVHSTSYQVCWKWGKYVPVKYDITRLSILHHVILYYIILFYIILWCSYSFKIHPILLLV